LMLFFSRAVLSYRNVNWRKKWPLLKFIPHIIDTLLLASGLSLAIYTSVPLFSGWLSIKLMLLVAYIFLGSYTLKKSTTKSQQFVGITATFVTISVMIFIALTKNFN